MRLEEFQITRYGGPVGYEKPFKLSDFTLFWGNNERGKTLTIDALVKLLLGKEAKRFVRIDRVDEKPAGYAVVSIGSEQYKLPDRGTLTDVCDLTEAECRNIFIVRASDLSIGQDEKGEKGAEADFYAAVTDRLTGLRTKTIARIREALIDRARLTPTGDFRDIKDEKLKTRLGWAAALTEEMEPLIGEVREAGYDELESRQIEAAELIERIDLHVNQLEDARKRDKYEKGRDALVKLADSRRVLKDLDRYQEEDGQKWRDAEREITSQGDEIRSLKEAITRLGKDLSETEAVLARKERDFKTVDERKRTLDEQTRPDLKNFEAECDELARKRGAKWVLALSFAVFALTACASLFGAVLRPNPLFLGALALLGAGAAVSLILLFVQSRREARLGASFEGIRLALARFDLGGSSVAEIKKKIQRFDEAHRSHREELEGIRRKRGIIEARISDTEAKIPRYENQIREARQTIEQIQRASGCETLEQFAGKLSLKRATAEIAREQIKVLEGGFERTGGNLDAQVASWEEQVRSLSRYGEGPRAVEFSESASKKAQDQKKAASEEMERIAQSLAEFRKVLEGVERRTNDILQDGDNRVYCETSADLESVRDRLAAFRAEHEADRSAALTATGIFDDIEGEEKARVSLLFDRESEVSDYFSRVTGGAYEGVRFDPAQGIISVTASDGTKLTADKLSSGAYDQLYLAVRLALGRRVAPDGAGFFIMDDPFIRSDPERLALQMRVLADVAAGGWQIIYFSSKGEVKDALAKEIKKGAVTLYPL